MRNCPEPYQRLETELARWAGVDHVVACNSGTAALHLALEAMQLPQGSGVATCDFNMISVPRAISLAGLQPVFVDCRDDLLIDPELIDKACSENNNIRAVLPVHIYGRQCAMNEIIELARKYNLHVIEDLAEAHGVDPHPDSDAAAWSFYANKIVTSGEEGGAVAFRSGKAAALARQLRCLGFDERHDFQHVPRGINARLANSLAAKILDSLEHFKPAMLARRQIEGWYNEACPDQWRMPPRDAPWIYDVRIPELGKPDPKSGYTEYVQDRVVRALQQEKIAARYGFKPMTVQQEYAGCRRVSGINAALRASREVIYLPVQPGKVLRADCIRAFEIIAAELRE